LAPGHFEKGGVSITTLGNAHVRVEDGCIVAASDRGACWSAGSAGSGRLRMLTHLLVLVATVLPLGATVASAHPAPPLRHRIEIGAARRDHPEAAVALALDPVVSPHGAPSSPPAQPTPPVAPPPVAGGVGGHFPFGWCTYYVSTKRYIPWSGDAITWYGSAQARSWPVGHEPRVGAIMVSRDSAWGHVAYVEAADSSCWTVSEMNFHGFGVVDQRHVCMGQVPLVGFIY
jgi:hypothetical protein